MYNGLHLSDYAYLLAKLGVDTAENELLEVVFNIIQYYSFVSLAVTFETKKGSSSTEY